MDGENRIPGATDIDFRKMTVGTVRRGYEVVVCPWCGKNAILVGGEYIHTGQEIVGRGENGLIYGKMICTVAVAVERLYRKATWSVSALKNMDMTNGHFMEAYDRGMILLRSLRTAIGDVRRGVYGVPPKRKERHVSKRNGFLHSLR